MKPITATMAHTNDGRDGSPASPRAEPAVVKATRFTETHKTFPNDRIHCSSFTQSGLSAIAIAWPPSLTCRLIE